MLGLSFAILLASLLTVVVARALLDQGAVRLQRLESQLASEQARHVSDELRVAGMESPSRVSEAAHQQGFQSPNQVRQVPSVPLSTPIAPPAVAASPAAATSATGR